MILSSSSFVSYWISPAVAPARVGLCVTLMLAQFALMSSISKELPRMSYMTWLDYLLAATDVKPLPALRFRPLK